MAGRASPLIACAALAAAPAGVDALGFGAPERPPVLGRMLDLRIPIVLDGGEPAPPDCWTVDVTHGDTRLDPQVVRHALEDAGRTLRVRTLVPIEEPVLRISVGAGCPPKFQRLFTAFADPPSSTPASEAGTWPIASSALPAVAAAGTATMDRLDSARRSADDPPPAIGAPTHRRSTPMGLTATADSPHSKGDAGAAVERHTKSGAGRAVAAAAVMLRSRSARGGSRLRVDPLPVAAAASKAGAHLVLDAGEPMFMGPAAGVDDPSAAAASAARAADAARLQALERAVARLDGESRAHRADAERLRVELASARGASGETPWWIGLLACGAIALGALVWRLRHAVRPQRWWSDEAANDGESPIRAPEAARAGSVSFDAPPVPESPSAATAASTAAPIDPAPATPQSRPPAPAAAPAPADVAVAPLAFADMTASAPASASRPTEGPASIPLAPFPAVHASATWKQTMPAPSDTALAPASPAAARVEALLDLEQQVDFFTALGQDEAAIDLLMTHIGSVEQPTPWPYAQLLALHGHRGDAMAYERIRAAYEERFERPAPAWADRVGVTVALEGEAAAVERLQSLWSAPDEAMAEIESMLLGETEPDAAFQLAAHGDLLTLYALARDRLQGADVADDIDLLLPLDDGASDTWRRPSTEAVAAPGAGATAFADHFEMKLA